MRRYIVRYSLPKSITVAAAMACALASGAHAAMTISSKNTKNVTCSGGVCTPSGNNPNLNVGDLAAMLASSDVTVKSNAVVPSIGVLDSLTWGSKHRLTLDANTAINVRALIAVESKAAMALITNDGGTGGELSFGSGGSINFWDLHSTLLVNGHRYKLVGDIATLANRIALKPSGAFALAKNVDASTDGIYHAPPVPTLFDGGFEGLGNTISHLKIQSTKVNSNVGLFAQLGSNGTIRDILLDDVSVSGEGAASGKISNIGALVAVSSGQVLQSQASGSVSCVVNECGGAGPVYVGGLVGNGGSIIGSHAWVTVSGGSYSGGLAGNAAVVSYSDAHGDISSDAIDDGGHGFVAGLVATAGSIDHSTASGTITGTGSQSDAAGLAGTANTVAYSSASGTVTSPISAGLVVVTMQSVTQSHATGDVFGKYYAAGLVASASGTVSDSYATGKVSCTSDGCLAGGLIAAQFGKTRRSYATGAVSGGSGTGGLIGANNGGDAVISCFATGTVQTNVAYANAGGLVGGGGSISLSFATGSVSAGAKSNAGGLIGFGGTIRMSFASGNVSAGDNSRAGGLAGNSRDGISQSYATGSATGGIGSYVGGLAGYTAYGEISEVYSTGLVTGGLYRGGLVGHVDPSAAHAYWDFDTSGISNPGQGDGDTANYPGITGVTDAQLKSALPAGFDPNVWGQSPSINNGWPYLLANPPSGAKRKHR